MYPGLLFSQEEKSEGGGGPGSHDAQYDRAGLTNLFSFVIFCESVMSNYCTISIIVNKYNVMFSNIKVCNLCKLMPGLNAEELLTCC